MLESIIESIRSIYRGFVLFAFWAILVLFGAGGLAVGAAIGKSASGYYDDYTVLGMTVGMIVGVIVGFVIAINYLGYIATILNIDKNLEQLRLKTVGDVVPKKARPAIPNNAASIKEGAFRNKQPARVTIPDNDNVASIEEGAFRNKQLTSVIIPNDVTYIGPFAFSGNQLTSVTIPDSVASIGEEAFAHNQLAGITIGAGVTLADDAFGCNGFEEAYNNGGRQAGTYTRSDAGSWEWTKR